MSSTIVQLTITMDHRTVRALRDTGSRLYIFKGIRASAAGGVPTVWLSTDQLAENVMITWPNRLEGFTSTEQIISNRTIVPEFSVPLDPGETLEVAQDGKGSVVERGDPDTLTISNLSYRQLTCGIAQQIGSGTVPICAAPLPGGSADRFIPNGKVLVMFYQYPIALGTMTSRAWEAGLLVDTSGADGNGRTVSYDSTTGWSWGNGPWGSAVRQGEDMAQILIEQIPATHKVM